MDLDACLRNVFVELAIVVLTCNVIKYHVEVMSVYALYYLCFRSMALPTLSAHVPSRSRVLAGQLARQREQEARWRQQWELHAQYFREQSVRSQKQAVWSSRQSYQQR